MEIILVMSIVSPKYVHRIFKHHCWMRMSGCRRRLKIMTGQNLLPRIIVDVVFKEIIHSVEPIIASKDENRSWMHHWHMSVSSWGRHIIRFYLSPSVGVDVVAVEVIFASLSVVASKDVNLIFKSDARV